MAKVDLFRAEGIPVGPALTSQLTVMAAIGRQDDQALSARIPFMAAGPSKARTLQAAYMTATVSMPHPPQNSLALACERGPYMTVETLRLSTARARKRVVSPSLYPT